MSNLIIDAAQYAAEKHAGQKRKYSGLPYITHPARVASRVILHEIATAETVAAAWLHDVMEDCDVEYSHLKSCFGSVVADLCMELTNPSKGSQEPRQQRKLQDRQHLGKVSHVAKVIKLIDRIDNLQGLWCDKDKVETDFLKTYTEESALLLSALKDADSALANEMAVKIRLLADEVLERRLPVSFGKETPDAEA